MRYLTYIAVTLIFFGIWLLILPMELAVTILSAVVLLGKGVLTIWTTK